MKMLCTVHFPFIDKVNFIRTMQVKVAKKIRAMLKIPRASTFGPGKLDPIFFVQNTNNSENGPKNKNKIKTIFSLKFYKK